MYKKSAGGSKAVCDRYKKQTFFFRGGDPKEYRQQLCRWKLPAKSTRVYNNLFLCQLFKRVCLYCFTPSVTDYDRISKKLTIFVRTSKGSVQNGKSLVFEKKNDFFA